MPFTLKDFDYNLPGDLIAQEPAQPRDHSRLLVYDRKSGSVLDDYFYHIQDYIVPETTFVVNNSRVEKCRLLFDGGSREIFVLRQVNDKTIEALVRPGRKFRKGKLLELASGIEVEVTAVSSDGIRTLSLSHSLDDPVFDPYRSTPFPPYIKPDENLSEQYQTVFAQESGSKAAPTAGLHFTGERIRQLKKQGFGWEEITLHVGLGTFAPVKEEDIRNHILHSERYQLDEQTAGKLNSASHKTAVGTTSVRVLESASDDRGYFRAESGETDIFIKPGYRFKAVDSLVTNFHLPKSTLLMLVSAFMGLEETHRVYRHAVEQKYRFYSFGDAMLIV